MTTRVVVVMGVSGIGKTVVGRALADRLGRLDSLGVFTLARAGQPAVSLVVYRREGAALVAHDVY